MRVRIEETSQVAEARRLAAALAARVGMNETDAGRVSLIVTEAGTNLVKHTPGGEILLSRIAEDGVSGIQILAIDRAPGIGNLEAAMRDGHSTAGSPGTGLGAIQRLSDAFEIYSERGRGTILLVEVWPKNKAPRAGLAVGAICEPHPGEQVSGDSWDVRRSGERALVLVADGLGHGPDAAKASCTAVDIFRERPFEGPAAMVEAIHAGLHGTRGAAVAVALLDSASRQVLSCGLGNISGFILSADRPSRALLSHNGTAGHAAHRIQEFAYDWPPGAVVLLHSDGIATHWNIDAYPGLLARGPAVLAATLYRDHNRGRDDVSIVAVKSREP